MKRRISFVLCMTMLLLAGCDRKGTQAGYLPLNMEDMESFDNEIEQPNNLPAIVNEITSCDVKMTFPEDDEIKIKLAGETFVDAITEKDSIVIEFYNSKKGRYEDGHGLNFIIRNNQCKGSHLTNTDINNLEFDLFLDSDGQAITGPVVVEEDCVLMKIKIADIEQLVQSFVYYEIYSDENSIYSGTVKEDVTEKWYDIPSLPSEYVNEGDGEFFKPITDSYHVMKLDYPEYKAADLAWGVDYTQAAPFPGAICYTPMDAHNASLSVVLLESYDEFGDIMDAKAKVIYASTEEAMVAGVTRTQGLYPSLINGINEENEAVLEEHLADFLTDCLKESMTLYESDNGKTVDAYYDGHVDNILYFDYGTDQIEGTYWVVNSLSQIYASIDRVAWNELDTAGSLEKEFDYSYYYDFLAKSITDVIFVTGTMTGYSTIQKESHILAGTQEQSLTESGFSTQIYQSGFEDYPQDENYFRPMSEDYVVWFKVEPWDVDTTRNFEAYLVSYDENGELIQYVKRYMKAPNLVNDIEELIASDTCEDGMELLYSDESIYYVEQTQYINSINIYENKQELIDSVSRSALLDNSSIYVYISNQ
ncbi:MAG TPA: hypothetical protein VJ888_05200 [Mobilitalea sp.]|nr:hypothetical protein [Mobilitalea sp.]